MAICERMTQIMFETYNMQGLIVGYKANRERTTQSMFESYNVQGMIAATWANCERMTQGMVETHNVQGVTVGYSGQPRSHDPEHLRVEQLQGHKETSVLRL